jgi:GH35 family endo-1,4-beta-xylanase
MRKNCCSRMTLALVFFALLFVTQLSAQTLRSVVPAGKYLGTIMKDAFAGTDDANKPLSQLPVGSDIYNQVNIAGSHFSAFEMENGMKMSNILKNYNSAKFPSITTADLNLVEAKRFIKFCNDKGMRSRGHALMWYSQAPQWLIDRKPSKADINTFMQQYITAFVGALGIKGEIDEWDVANEMLLSNFDQNGYRTAADGTGAAVWYSNIAGAGQAGTAAYNTEIDNLLTNCYNWAHAADGAAKLFYNDYSIEDVNWAKSLAAYNLVSRLRGKGAAIDGVGFQSHFIAANFVNFSTGANIDFGKNIALNIRKFAGLRNASNQSILVSITELDIRNQGGNMSQQQVQDAYFNVVSQTLVEPNCNLLLIWGISEKDSWIGSVFGQTPYLLWDANYAQRGNATAIGGWKGVYDGLRNAGGGGGTTTTAPVGKAIYLKGSNAKFVSSENGAQTGITCNRTTVGGWERFTVVSAGNGKIALKGTNGRYISSENGAQAMRCDRTAIGTSEAFDWVAVNGTTVQLRGSNGQYVSSENGVGAMFCNRPSAGTWENFSWAENGAAFRTDADIVEAASTEDVDFGFYPNPNSTQKLTVELPAGTTHLHFMDYSGKALNSTPVNGERKVEIDLDVPSGIYILQIAHPTKASFKKLIVQ